MDNGHDSAYTIHVENHSKFDVEISCISLWSNGQRIGQDAFPPENDWCVPAQRSVLLQFDTQEDMAHRLWQLAGLPDMEASARQFRVDVVVALRCEIFGLERNFEESQTVQVDLLNRQISGL